MEAPYIAIPQATGIQQQSLIMDDLFMKTCFSSWKPFSGPLAFGG